jgi:hypothetical protein
MAVTESTGDHVALRTDAPTGKAPHTNRSVADDTDLLDISSKVGECEVVMRFANRALRTAAIDDENLATAANQILPDLRAARDTIIKIVELLEGVSATQ